MGLSWCAAFGITLGLHYSAQKVGTSMIDPKPQIQYYALYNYLFMTACAYASGKCHGIDFSMMGSKLFSQFPWQTQKYIIWRIAFGYGAFITSMLSVSLLPLSISTPLLMSSVFVTMIFGYFLAGEELSVREITTIVFGFIGIIIVMIPINEIPDGNNTQKNNDNLLLGLLSSAAFTICTAMKYISIRCIGENMHPSIKNYHLGLSGVALSLLITAYLDPGFFAFW